MHYSAQDIDEYRPPESACRDLWLAVIKQAIADAADYDQIARHRSNDSRTAWDIQRAVNWFTRGGDHFKMVCEMAGVEHTAVREKVLTLLQSPEEKRRVLRVIGHSSGGHAV